MAVSRLTRFAYQWSQVSCRSVLRGSLSVLRQASSSHTDKWGESSMNYKELLQDRPLALNKRLTAPNRFQKISEREDRSDLTLEAIRYQCKGKYLLQHRGCTILKTPDDMAILNELCWRLRPATVIELGTFTGASAIWIADMLKTMGVDTTLYSMDIDLSNVEDRVREIKPPNVHFLEGSSDNIEELFSEKMLQSLPHPWLVVDDAHANIYGLMKHFGSYMTSGDYFVIEDLHPYAPCRSGAEGVYDEEFKYGGLEVLTDLKKFLTDYEGDFTVDSFYTDLFGYNGTWNMHGYVCKM